MAKVCFEMIYTALAIALISPLPCTIRESAFKLVPPATFSLGGYTARSNKPAQTGGEPLFCRVLEFESKSVRIVVASAELLTIPESLYDKVAKAIGPDTHLFLTATHTHCAPDSQLLNSRMTFTIPGIARYSETALESYSNQIISAIRTNHRSKPEKPATLSYAMTHVELNRGRRRLAQPITELTSLKLGENTLWTSYAAHAVFYGPERMTTSGDWPGEVSKATDSLTLIGPIGDVSPAANGESAEDRIRDFRERFVHQLQSTLFHIPLDLGEISWSSSPIDLEDPSPSPSFEKEFGVPKALSKSIVIQFAPENANVSAFRIGKLAIVGIPGEPTSAIGRKIRDAGIRLGFAHVLVISHVNGWIGYILEPEDRSRGGYEAALGFHGESASAQVIQAATRALHELRD